MKKLCFCLLLLFPLVSFGQVTWHAKKHSGVSLTFSGFGDLYLGYQTNAGLYKFNFLYSHKFNRRVRNNLLLFRTEFKSKRFHSTLGLMNGDYVTYNLSSEPFWAKPLNEAYLGFKMLKKKNLWLDAGIYNSFIGYETMVSSDSPTLTRSIVADNSPYYLSGVRLLYTSENKKHEFGAHVLNGWQRIYFDPAIKRPAFGFHYKYNVAPDFSVMYTAFYGSVYPDDMKINRFYQHVNASYVKGKWTFISTIDLGIEAGYLWGAGQVIAKYQFATKWALANRVETFFDPYNRCLTSGTSVKKGIGGFSTTLDFQPNSNISIRMEPKVFVASKEILNSEQFSFMGNVGVAVKF
jgi:hypothetical protein